jgi:hypothetical protein
MEALRDVVWVARRRGIGGKAAALESFLREWLGRCTDGGSPGPMNMVLPTLQLALVQEMVDVEID